MLLPTLRDGELFILYLIYTITAKYSLLRGFPGAQW